MRTPSDRELHGRTIVAFHAGAYRVPDGRQTKTMHDPEIVLDDGTVLRFVVEENPDGGEYGVKVIRGRP